MWFGVIGKRPEIGEALESKSMVGVIDAVPGFPACSNAGSEGSAQNTQYGTANPLS